MRPPKEALSFLGLVLFSLAGSTLTRVLRLDPGPIAPVASLVTLALGLAAIFPAPRPWPRLAATFALGAASEMVGLATGLPFGPYAYTHAWWPTVELPFGPFPLALPFAWLLVAGAARRALPEKGSALGLAIGGGLLAAVVDLAMEPVMAGPLGYWHWKERGPLPGGAPILNFVGWWIVAAVAGFVVGAGARHVPARWTLGGFVVLVVGLGLIGRS